MLRHLHNLSDLVGGLHLWNSDRFLGLLNHGELLLDDLWYIHHSVGVLRLKYFLGRLGNLQHWNLPPNRHCHGVDQAVVPWQC